MGAPASDPTAADQTQSSKAALRRTVLAARRDRPLDGRAEARRHIALLAVPEIADAAVVAAYAGLAGEPEVAPLLAALRQRSVRVLLPLIKADGDLDFREARRPLVAGRLGIRVPPPDAPLVPLGVADVILVPALAADREGRRLGRGGGSYDRALQRMRAGALVIAVVHPEELLSQVPVEPHDVRVSAVLAGAELIRTGR